MLAENVLFGNIDIKLIVMLLQSLSHIMDVSMEDLARCPGIGERKVFVLIFFPLSLCSDQHSK